MNHADGWMGGGMWLWAVIGGVAVALNTRMVGV